MEKRGISPVIATVLLISITLVLAVIIFVAFSALLKEKATKFDEPIENACGAVSFVAEAFPGTGNVIKISVSNQGNVPIYAIKVLKSGEGSLEEADVLTDSESTTVPNGDTKDFDYTGDLIAGDEITIVPVILGSTGTEGQTSSYACADAGYITTVRNI